jgi:outer membrane receptor protein involved in Fe transport
VLPVDAAGVQTSPTPLSIAENGVKNGRVLSLFAQDEWTLTPALTVNYGLRYDTFSAYVSEHQLSPRLNAVWKPGAGTTVHVGYARYFTPPPFELVGNETVALFRGTTAEPPGTRNDTPRAERADYFDVGVEQKVGRLTLGLDTYDKRSTNLIDEGQFGAPIIQTPFNYAQGRQRGVELSGSYLQGPFSAYASLALAKAEGRHIVSSQFNFDPADLAYIATHFIPLDHDQRVTASAGATYRWRGSVISGDVIYGSGLRAAGETPNGLKLPQYAQVNVGLSHEFELPRLGRLEARADIINLFDSRYILRNGSGIGVGAPQYGPRRGLFGGLTKSF